MLAAFQQAETGGTGHTRHLSQSPLKSILNFRSPPSKKPKIQNWTPSLQGGSSGSSSGLTTTPSTAPPRPSSSYSSSSATPVSTFVSPTYNLQGTPPREQRPTPTNTARPLTAYGATSDETYLASTARPLTAYGATSNETYQDHSTRVWRSREWSDWSPQYSEQQQWEWSNWSSSAQSSGTSSQPTYSLSAKQALLNAVGRETREFAERLPEDVLAGIFLSTSGPRINNRPNYFANAVRNAAVVQGWL